ncbi:hypothetical protein CALCODRAFT_202338 [Calocera cornea HHB12733]|uniref:Uncharacterized protein n=1 Tax=Calocera cornea HHB12733 TaxID=1353952 RepID=A0A165JXZ5_9BASI|nr:hypothetical protein CALCODRAFT_202338 [Calocera cornea HHB12733]
MLYPPDGRPGNVPQCRDRWWPPRALQPASPPDRRRGWCTSHCRNGWPARPFNPLSLSLTDACITRRNVKTADGVHSASTRLSSRYVGACVTCHGRKLGSGLHGPPTCSPPANASQWREGGALNAHQPAYVSQRRTG